MRGKRSKNYVIGTVVIAILLSLKTYYDNRERSLVDVINYDQNDFNYLASIKEPHKNKDDKDWTTSDIEPVEELMSFLSQYQVKKINEEKFNESTNESNGFIFGIYNYRKESKVVRMYEDKVYIPIRDYYEVVNGPIDMEWINNYYEKYGELYE